MPKSIPLRLVEATITMFVQDINGQPILTQPVWIGARAEGLELAAEITETEATPSGSVYDQHAQLSEQHQITIDRIWVLPFGPEAGAGAVRLTDYSLTRGQFVMQIHGLDERTGIWHDRVYYGVQAKRYDLRSVAVDRQFGSNQIFRALYYIPGSGTSNSSGTLTPVASSAFEQPLLFTHDDPVLEDNYFIGYYQFSVPVTIGLTKAIASASQVTPTVLTLEIAGVLTSTTLTLPAGSVGEEVSDEQTFAVSVQAHASIRWKVTSAPGNAEYASVTMRIQEA